jgi:hypothetical protein
MEISGRDFVKGGRAVTPSVLPLKQLTKACHEHLGLFLHVLKCVEQFYQLKIINKNVKWKLMH